jgi:transposase
MSNLFWLTDAQMVRLEPFFPESHGKPRVDDRRVWSGIIFINRNGLQWCDAPKEYGPPKTLCNRLDLHRFCSGRVLILSGPLFEGHG